MKDMGLRPHDSLLPVTPPHPGFPAQPHAQKKVGKKLNNVEWVAEGRMQHGLVAGQAASCAPALAPATWLPG